MPVVPADWVVKLAVTDWDPPPARVTLDGVTEQLVRPVPEQTALRE